MKTAKKLFSLLLVAVLMLSALPFQASADELTKKLSFRNDADSQVSASEFDANGRITGSIPTTSQVTTDSSKELSGWEIVGKSGVLKTTQDIANEAIGTIDDSEFFVNNAGTVKFLKARPMFDTKAHVCTFDGEPEVVEATCTTTGSKTYTCECGKTKVETIAKLGHEMGDWRVTEDPSLTETGAKVRDCVRTNCNYSEPGIVEKAKATITFKYRAAQGGEVFDVKQVGLNETVKVEDGKNVPEYNFIGWFDADYNQLGDGIHGWNGENDVFYATYEEDPANDNMSKITVKARIYNNGIAQGYDRTLLTSEYIDNGTRILDYLDSKESEIRAAIYAINPEYKWDGYYYNDDLKTTLTSQEKINGNKTILIKVDVNPSNQVRVIVYRHDKVSSAAVPAYALEGFTAGDTVTISDVQKAIKDVTGRTYSIKTIYDEDEWNQLLDGETVYGDTRKIVPDEDVFVLHVVSTSYTGSSSTSSKPASNPSTGDPIMATAGIMVLAAAALVSILELRKRKMI